VVVGLEASDEGKGVDGESSEEDNAGKACRGKSSCGERDKVEGKKCYARERGYFRIVVWKNKRSAG
jgi:hypothetical protein